MDSGCRAATRKPYRSRRLCSLHQPCRSKAEGRFRLTAVRLGGAKIGLSVQPRLCRLHRTRPHHRRHRSASLPLRRRHGPPRRRAPRRLPPKSARQINPRLSAALPIAKMAGHETASDEIASTKQRMAIWRLAKWCCLTTIYSSPLAIRLRLRRALVVAHALAKNRFKRPPPRAAATRAWPSQKEGAHGDYGLLLTAIMLRHKHSNSRSKGKPVTLTSVDDAD